MTDTYGSKFVALDPLAVLVLCSTLALRATSSFNSTWSGSFASQDKGKVLSMAYAELPVFGYGANCPTARSTQEDREAISGQIGNPKPEFEVDFNIVLDSTLWIRTAGRFALVIGCRRAALHASIAISRSQPTTLIRSFNKKNRRLGQALAQHGQSR